MAGMTAAKLAAIHHRHGTHAPCSVFVETGTFEGKTTALAAAEFRTVFSCEIKLELYRAAAERLSVQLPNVSLLFGDSRWAVQWLAERIGEPCCWYLDAHWFKHPAVGGQEEGLPLWDELRAIAARRDAKGEPFRDIIVVDDVNDFGKPKPTPEWVEVTLERIAAMFPGHAEAVILHDQAVVYR